MIQQSMQQAQQFAEQHPIWSWFAVAASAATAWLAPIASAVAIVLGCLNIYWGWKKHRRDQGK